MALPHLLMTTETQDSPGAESEIVAPVTVQEPPEVTAPESNEAEQQPQEKPEQDDSDKSLKRLQRRVDRVTAARYQAEARASQLEQELARYRERTANPEEPQQQQQFRPEDIDRLATERAREIATAQEVARRSNDTFNDGLKSFGEVFKASVATVIDEAGPLITERGSPTPLGEAILDSDKPAELLHYLGQNPDIAESLQGLSAARLGRRLSAIESEMKQAKVSKAPAPLKPVTPKGAPIAKAESEMTDAEWYRARRKK